MYNTLTKEELLNQIKSCTTTSTNSNFTIMTGLGGVRSFNTEIVIETSTDLKQSYRDLNINYYEVLDELTNIKSKRIYKIFKFLKLL